MQLTSCSYSVGTSSSLFLLFSCVASRCHAPSFACRLLPSSFSLSLSCTLSLLPLTGTSPCDDRRQRLEGSRGRGGKGQSNGRDESGDGISLHVMCLSLSLSLLCFSLPPDLHACSLCATSSLPFPSSLRHYVLHCTARVREEQDSSYSHHTPDSCCSCCCW